MLSGGDVTGAEAGRGAGRPTSSRLGLELGQRNRQGRAGAAARRGRGELGQAGPGADGDDGCQDDQSPGRRAAGHDQGRSASSTGALDPAAAPAEALPGARRRGADVDRGEPDADQGHGQDAADARRAASRRARDPGPRSACRRRSRSRRWGPARRPGPARSQRQEPGQRSQRGRPEHGPAGRLIRRHPDRRPQAPDGRAGPARRPAGSQRPSPDCGRRTGAASPRPARAWTGSAAGPGRR